VLGTEATVRAVLADDTPILADKGAASGLEKTVELASSVTAPVEAGQKLGTLVLRSDGTPLAQIDLVAETAVPRLSWWQLTVQLLRAVCLS
jgi:D-alanyl-D-alanine carboxypeptidase (penicillin-binding protein 5/6)